MLGAGSREDSCRQIEENIAELEATYETSTGKTMVNTGIKLIATRDKLKKQKKAPQKLLRPCLNKSNVLSPPYSWVSFWLA